MLANGNGSAGMNVNPVVTIPAVAATTNPNGTGSTASTGGSGGGGSRMAVIGVTRNIKLRRRGNAGFGFSLRGGREYSAGFYVSDVVPGGEAHAHGLRVGDQILRVNGYPVEDAIHQEVALLAKNQQVLVLKIRSVGMVPIKDNPNDPVTWHMVQQQQHQLQFGDAVTNEMRVRVVLGEKGRLGCGVCKGLVPGLTVQGTREGGPARAAGLKAGDIITWCNGQSLTDQPFEKAIESMRNSAVLDLIVNRPIVNGQHVYDSPDVLYGIPPRASSGYDTDSMSSSYHAGTSSPRRTGMMDPRMTQTMGRNRNVCCPPNVGSGAADWGHVEQSQEWTRKPNNTTIIRISQSNNHSHQHAGGPNNIYGSNMGTPSHQQYHQQHQRRNSAPIPARPPMLRSMPSSYDEDDMMMEEPIYDPVAPVRDYECHDFDANPRDEVVRRAEFRREHGIREAGYELLTNEESDFGKENGASSSASVSPISSTGTSSSSCGSVTFNTLKRPTTSSSNNSTNSADKEQQQQTQQQQQQQQQLLLQQQQQRKQVTTVEVHQPCPPAAPPQPQQLQQQQPYKWPAETKPMNAMGMQMGSTMSMGSTGSTETESSLESSCGKDSASTSSSLSTSSSCEQQSTGALSFANSIAAAAAAGAKSMSMDSSCNTIRHRPNAIGPVKVPPPPPPPTIDLGSAITQELQRRAKQRSMNNASGQDPQQQQGGGAQEARKPQNPEALRAQEQKVTHDKLMEEFKRAHQRMFNNAQRGQNGDQTGEQTEEKRTNPSTTTTTTPTATKEQSQNNETSSTAKTPTKTGANRNDESVEMQSIESFKLKNTANKKHVPKPPPTYFQSNTANATTTPSATSPSNNNNKPKVMVAPLKPTPIITSARCKDGADNLPKPGKVALRIGTYEAELKKPSKLGFLGQSAGKLNKVVSNASSNSSNTNGNGTPVTSRLQNELAATLQKSNLRVKTEGDKENPSATEDSSKTSQETNQTSTMTSAQSNVDKLATALNNKVTIRINPEATNR